MPNYVVCYDLKKPGQEYPAIRKELESFDHLHAQRSVYLVSFNGQAGDLRDHLRQYIDSNDQLIVTGISGWATLGTVAATTWLREHTS